MPHTNIATRGMVIGLKVSGMSTKEIACLTGLTESTVNRIYGRAREAGFDKHARPLRIEDSHLTDNPRSGRPSKQSKNEEQILNIVRRDRYGREKSCADIAGDLSLSGVEISATTIWRVLHAAGFHKTKPTRKPGLTARMKKERLDWCLARQHWTLEDWKAVIWSDETSVVLLHRRGGYRIWRTAKEKVNKTCIRERWKGSSEFMFWGSFSYDKKGPCYCWRPETAVEKRLAEEELEAMNKALEPAAKEAWELSMTMSRLNLRQKTPGKKPTWRWNKKSGKLTRGGKGGIDWYRYRKHILGPKLLPFAQECALERQATLVQEDKAPAHAHHIQQQLYDLEGVQRLEWCGNSPDLNMIEPAWPWLKRFTTKKGAPKSRSDAIARWQKAWTDLPQAEIQRWIERIPRHIKKIIELGGGNEYVEGRQE
jgi:transposase